MFHSYSQYINGKLLKRINDKREELISLAAKYGLESKKVVKCSQELDALIYQVVLHNMDEKRLVELRRKDRVH